jgi:subtilisin family serine protease
LLGGTALVSLLALSIVSAGGAANSATRISSRTVSEVGFDSARKITPFALTNRPMIATVELAGDSVSEVEAADPESSLTSTAEEHVAQSLQSSQSMLRPQIEALGGTVLGSFKYAYNGLKVRIDPDKLGQLAQLPGVVGVHPARLVQRSHANSLPLLGVPGVWDLAVKGNGVRIAVIDSGIDYTHADFGGPGTSAAFDAADAHDTEPPDPSLLGPKADTKVKGGFDFVGDDYNPYSDDQTQWIPKPDPNPLDCDGHGTHVAGTAAGYGVTSAGDPFMGPWRASTFPGSFKVGPGVAPLAELLAFRVFGCAGGALDTDTVAAIDLAVKMDADVINMSLGEDWQTDDPAAIASTNAAKAGVIVVSAAGNSGPAPYIAGTPAAADRTLSAAALDPVASFPGATMALSTGETITVSNSNGATFADGTTYQVQVLVDDPATPLDPADPTTDESLGCSVAAYTSQNVAGKLAVTNRGGCARVARAIFGQQAGAAAVAMVNNAPGLPPFEGEITVNPDTGEEFTVTIPFFGVAGPFTDPQSDGAKLKAASSVTVTNVNLPNPTFKAFADFTSAGPRGGDSFLRPLTTAPGVSIHSALIGSGTEGTRISGTSMASPHVAGIAALVRDVHPRWDTEDINAAIVNTGSPDDVTDYSISRGGTGLAQPLRAIKTRVTALGNDKEPAVNFGFRELDRDFSRTRTIELTNHGSWDATFVVSAGGAEGSPHTVALSRTRITVRAGRTAHLEVRLRVPVGTVGDSNPDPAGDDFFAFREVAGLITFAPADADENRGVSLRVPYYLVPRALSNIETKLADSSLSPDSPATTATVRNRHAAIAGTADFYAWGLADPRDAEDRRQAGRSTAHDLRAVGVQSFEDGDDRLLVFAVNTWERWSNAASNEFDIYVDTNDDGVDDFLVAGLDLVDLGLPGVMGSVVISLPDGELVDALIATAPTDSSTALLPVAAGALGLSEADPRFSYRAESFGFIAPDELGVRQGNFLGVGHDEIAGGARFNAWSSSISQGMFVGPLAPGATSDPVAVSIDPVEWTLTPARGLMVVSLDNASGKPEAELLDVRLSKRRGR